MKMLDHLANAVNYKNDRWKHLTRYDLAAEYFRNNKIGLQFDLWLVSTKDPLGFLPGTPESRFCTKVIEMYNSLPRCKGCDNPSTSNYCNDCRNQS